MNLRTRILQSGIRCHPWYIWKGEIDLLPISSQTLFRNTGVSIDLLEIELKSEGWLFEEEGLLELIKDVNNLKRNAIIEIGDNKYGGFPDDWTEEDYIDHFKT